MPSWVWFLAGFIAGEIVLTVILILLQRLVFHPVAEPREALHEVREGLRNVRN